VEVAILEGCKGKINKKYKDRKEERSNQTVTVFKGYD